LDHLQHARRQLVALGELLALFFKSQIELVTLLLQGFLGVLQHQCVLLISQTDVEPLPAIQIVQVVSGQLGALGQLAWTTVDGFADQELQGTVKGVVFNDLQLVVQVLAVATQFIINDGLGTLVTLDTFTGKDLNVDHRTDHARRHAQGGVFNVRGFFTKNGAQQLFFRSQLSFTLGCHFTDQHVVGTYFGADVHNAGIVQTVQLNFGQVADIAGDILRSQLRVTGNNRQLFDVNRSVAIISHDLLGDQNRVLEVVAVPGHKGDQHVLTQRQFAQVSRCAVSQHVTTRHDIATFDDRTLVDVGVLVGTGVFGHVVDIYTDLTCHVLVIVHTNNHALCINVHHHTATTGLYGRTRVNRYRTFDTGTDQRLLRAQARNCLTLHVGAHQCSVGVIVLQERNQRRSHRHDLRRSHVHVMDVLWRRHHGFTRLTAGNQIICKSTVFGQFGVSLSDDVIAFFNGRQVIDLLADLTVNNHAVRG